MTQTRFDKDVDVLNVAALCGTRTVTSNSARVLEILLFLALSDS